MNNPVCIRLNRGFSPTFPAAVGLRQGCPLSPLLFGLYIDDLEPLLLQHPSAAFPLLNSTTLPPLFYSDDLAILSTTAAGLQAQLNALQAFCTTYGLTINLIKTNIVIFSGSTNHSWTLNSLPVSTSDSYVYLGHQFAGTGSLSTAGHLRATRATATFHALRRRAAETDITRPKDLCWLFDCLIRPSLEYGCEIWSPQWICSWYRSPLSSAAGHVPSRQLLSRLLRSLLHLPVRGTSLSSLYSEFGIWPLEIRFMAIALNFWHRLQNLPPNRLAAQAFLAAQALADSWEAHNLPPSTANAPGPSSTHIPVTSALWVAQVRCVLCNLNALSPDSHSIQSPANDIVTRLQTHYLLHLNSQPQTSHGGFYVSTIRSNITQSDYLPQPYLLLLNPHHRRILANTRLAITPLRSWAIPAHPHGPQCPHCPSHLESLEHMLYHCPFYTSLRLSPAIAPLLESNPTLADLFSGDPSHQGQVAKLLQQFYATRESSLASLL